MYCYLHPCYISIKILLVQAMMASSENHFICHIFLLRQDTYFKALCFEKINIVRSLHLANLTTYTPLSITQFYSSLSYYTPNILGTFAYPPSSSIHKSNKNNNSNRIKRPKVHRYKPLCIKHWNAIYTICCFAIRYYSFKYFLTQFFGSPDWLPSR